MFDKTAFFQIEYRINRLIALRPTEAALRVLNNGYNILQTVSVGIVQLLCGFPNINLHYQTFVKKNCNKKVVATFFNITGHIATIALVAYLVRSVLSGILCLIKALYKIHGNRPREKIILYHGIIRSMKHTSGIIKNLLSKSVPQTTITVMGNILEKPYKIIKIKYVLRVIMSLKLVLCVLFVIG